MCLRSAWRIRPLWISTRAWRSRPSTPGTGNRRALSPELLETRTDPSHLGRIDAGFNHRRHERGEYRSCRTTFSKKFRVHSRDRRTGAPCFLRPNICVPHTLQAWRWMVFGGIDDVKLVAVLQNCDVVARNHRHDRENRAGWFPALGTAASVIVSDIALDADLDLLLLAFADQRAAGKTARTLSNAAVNRWMDVQS